MTTPRHRQAPRRLAELPEHKVKQITDLAARQSEAEMAFVLADEEGEGYATANVLRRRLLEVMKPGESAALARLLDSKLGGLNAERQVDYSAFVQMYNEMCDQLLTEANGRLSLTSK